MVSRCTSFNTPIDNSYRWDIILYNATIAKFSNDLFGNRGTVISVFSCSISPPEQLSSLMNVFNRHKQDVLPLRMCSLFTHEQNLRTHMHICKVYFGTEKHQGVCVILTPLYSWYAGPVYMITAMISPRFNLAFRTSGSSDFRSVLGRGKGEKSGGG